MESCERDGKHPCVIALDIESVREEREGMLRQRTEETSFGNFPAREFLRKIPNEDSFIKNRKIPHKRQVFLPRCKCNTGPPFPMRICGVFLPKNAQCSVAAFSPVF
jgi:hypothetical protein